LLAKAASISPAGLEVVSKLQIMFESKAQADEKSAAYIIEVCEHFEEVCNTAIGH